MRPKPSGRFALREIKVKKRIDGQPLEYSTFLLSGWVRGKRYRKQFKSRELALGEKNALEVEAANVGGEIRALNTRSSVAQLALSIMRHDSCRICTYDIRNLTLLRKGYCVLAQR